MEAPPGGFEIAPLPAARVHEVVALVLRCDETWVEWAPTGWRPPPADRERRSWEERLRAPWAWTRGALERGRLLGVVSWRQARKGAHGPRVPGRAHVTSLFVEPDAWGGGVGSGLLEAAEGAMRAAGYGVAGLRVAEGNPARAFYERDGWALAGEPSYSPELDIRLVLYEKDL